MNRVLGLGQATLDATQPATAAQRQASAAELDVGRQPPSADVAHIPDGSHYGDKRANGVVHFGVDIPVNGAAADAPVVAPETLTIVNIWRDNATAPFVGYGPAGVLGKGASGRFHLLGHMDPKTFASSASSNASAIAIGQTFAKGELIGLAATGGEGLGRAQPHVHWEVRIQPIDSPSTRAGNTLDPIQWLAGLDVQAKTSGPGIPWWLVALAILAFGKKRR